MNFKSLFQNLVGILKCTFKQSYRVQNFKQLLFLDQLVKMSFSCSKRKFGAVCLKKKRKGILFLDLGRALLSGPAGQDGSACLPRARTPAVPTALKPRPRCSRNAPSPRAEPLLPPSALHFLLFLFALAAAPQACRRSSPPSSTLAAPPEPNTSWLQLCLDLHYPVRTPSPAFSSGVRLIRRFLLRHRRGGRRARP
jgi:hypothetical protein